MHMETLHSPNSLAPYLTNRQGSHADRLVYLGRRLQPPHCGRNPQVPRLPHPAYRRLYILLQGSGTYCVEAVIGGDHQAW